MATAVGEFMHVDVAHGMAFTGSSGPTQGASGIELRLLPPALPAHIRQRLARDISQARHHGGDHEPCLAVAAGKANVNRLALAL